MRWILTALTLIASMPATAQTVWSGPDVIITQSEPFMVTDILVAGEASLGRGQVGPLCNTEGGDTCTNIRSNPSNFEFAFSNLNGNPTIVYGSAASYAGYTFTNLATASDGGIGNNLRNVPGVGHVLSSDIYFDFEITSWQAGGLGGFTYRRSTPPPVPVGAFVPIAAGAALLAVGAAQARRRPWL